MFNKIIKSSINYNKFFSSTAKVWIDKNTKVICQGFTGKQVIYKIYKNRQHFIVNNVLIMVQKLLVEQVQVKVVKHI